MNTVEERLRQLEQSVRRWQKMTVGLGLVLAAGVTLAATGSDVAEVIRCRSLEIVDEKGQWVVSLDAWLLGGRIDVRNAAGKRTTTIAQSDNSNGMLKVFSSDEKNLVYAGAAKGRGDGMLSVLTKEGETLVAAGADTLGDGELEIYGKGGKVLTFKPGQ